MTRKSQLDITTAIGDLSAAQQNVIFLTNHLAYVLLLAP